MSDPYYRTKEWRQLRVTALERDGYTCVVLGCRQRATHVDHIRSRRKGGPDTLDNLRSLCATHDAQIKERPNGQRSNNGTMTVKGSKPDGRPLDPHHPWNLVTG